jgi:molecular chaperone Hsp33
MVQKARTIHATSPTVTAAFGRLLTGAALLGTVLKEPSHRIILQVHGRGPVQKLMAESDGLGRVRGYPGVATADMPSRHGKLDVGGVVGQGMLHVIKEVGNPEPTTGTVPLENGEIAEDLAAYLLQSEQIPSAVALGVFVRHDYVVTAAGGFLVQFHAEIDAELIAHIEQALAHTPAVTAMVQAGYQPQDMLQRALGDLPLDVVRHGTPQWSCYCSRERVIQALIAMGRQELYDLIVKEGSTEIRCEFCTTVYTFQKEELEALLAEAMRDD